MSGVNLIYFEETFKLRRAVFEVYKDKGAGFVEAVYQECLEFEFGLNNILFVPQPRLELAYKGRKLRSTFQPDFICFGKIIVELKAVTSLCDDHRAQVHNYLKATGLKLGLLINFGHYPKLEIERIIR